MRWSHFPFVIGMGLIRFKGVYYFILVQFLCFLSVLLDRVHSMYSIITRLGWVVLVLAIL